MRHIPFLLIAIALVAAACASESDTGSTASTFEVSETEAPPTTTTAPRTSSTLAETTTTVDSTSDADKEAITVLYEVVFSSETTYEEKAPLLVDPSGLEDTVAKYHETGTLMGGVALAATKISVTGDGADVTYDLLFGGTPTYTDLSGDAILIDGAWMITREMFCSIMVSARVGCPGS